jgi:hypothetical protein
VLIAVAKLVQLADTDAQDVLKKLSAVLNFDKGEMWLQGWLPSSCQPIKLPRIGYVIWEKAFVDCS